MSSLSLALAVSLSLSLALALAFACIAISLAPSSTCKFLLASFGLRTKVDYKLMPPTKLGKGSDGDSDSD